VAGSLPADRAVRDAAAFRAVLGRFATGVGVMTTVRDGIPHAMTANAVSSVSLDPPLVLVCVERTAVMAGEVAASGVFALSFLAADQAHLSDRFSDPDRPQGAAQFDGVEVEAAATGVTGAPILAGALGWLDCRVWASYDGGDHDIVVGEVVALEVGSADDPLLYYRSGYGRLAR
jgi:flavin reductase